MYQFASPLMQRMLPFFQRLSQNGTRLQAPGVMSGMRTPEMLDPGVFAGQPAAPQAPTHDAQGIPQRGIMPPPPAPPAPPPAAPPMNPYAGLDMGMPQMPAPPPQLGPNPFPQPMGAMPQGNPFPQPMGAPPRRWDILTDDMSLDRGRML
jgi:hypothetical protein